MPESSRLVAFHQYAGPVSILVLGIGAIALIAFAGTALIRGSLDGASFVAIAAQFFGLVGTALGVSSTTKREGRTGDPPANGVSTTTVTTPTTPTGGH